MFRSGRKFHTINSVLMLEFVTHCGQLNVYTRNALRFEMFLALLCNTTVKSVCFSFRVKNQINIII